MKTYEMIEYADNVRFRIHNITRQEIFDEGGNIKNVLDHWHREIEVVYTYVGNAKHYIDGCRIQRVSIKSYRTEIFRTARKLWLLF